MPPIKDLIRSPFHLIQKLGWKEGITQGFRYFLKRKDIVFHYPNSSRWYTVDFDIGWKYMERGKSSESGCITYLQKKVVKPNDVIIDVGANVGQYTLLFSELVGKEGRIIAFEPDPVNIRTLRSNLERNKVTNAVIEPKCVSKSRGSVVLAGKSLGTSESSIVRYQGQQASLQSVKVDAISLDEYCQENKLSPNGVKIDVEGAEGVVLKGMEQLIKKCKPWVLIELHGEFLNEHSVETIWYYIQSCAEQAIFMDGGDQAHKLGDSVNRELPPFKTHFRVLVQF